jgi:Domain of unknown function (DUF4253)
MMNLRVTRRPQTRSDALALAREQYMYCPDNVDQGLGTLNAFAAHLMANPWWDFWWDNTSRLTLLTGQHVRRIRAA